MIDGRGILRYSRDVQRDRRTGKDNFLCKFADAFSPCEGIETSSALLKYFVIIDASSLSAGIILHSYYRLHWRSWAIVYIPRYRRLFITS